MNSTRPSHHPSPLLRGAQRAYRAVLASTAATGALLWRTLLHVAHRLHIHPVVAAISAVLLLVALCSAGVNLQALYGSVMTLVFCWGPVVAGLILWVRHRQHQQELAQARAAWLAEQERQRLAYEAQVAEQQRQWRLMHLKTISNLLVMTPTEFEHAIADLLTSLGFVNVQHIGKSGDRGADILCFTPDGMKVIVQCKLYGLSKKVTSPQVQTFMGARETYGAAKGLFVTTSTFTQDAHDLAEGHNLVLIDGEQLTELSQKAAQPGHG